MRRSRPSSLKLLDHHLAAVGQLLAQHAEQLLAQQLGGEEALVAVGELVRRDRPAGASGSASRSARSSSGRFLPVLRAHRHDGLEVARLRQPLEERDQVDCACATRSILFTAAMTCCSAGMRSSTGAVVGAEAQRLDHEQRPRRQSRAASVARRLSARLQRAARAASGSPACRRRRTGSPRA